MNDTNSKTGIHTENSPERSEIQNLIYLLSHDLNAPIRHIQSFTQILLDSYSSALPNDAKELLGYIDNSANRAHEMIEALLIYSRLSTPVEKREDFSLAELWREISEKEQAAISECQAVIELQWETDPLIYGTRSQWGMLLSALLKNALLFQPAGRQPCIQITFQKTNGSYCLAFHDNGIGVQPKNYPQITLPFKRLHTETDYPGAGMGLAFCKRILQLHQCELEFESSQSGGLQVKCILPEQMVRT